MSTTKEALAPLIYQIALDEKMISSVEEARELERKLRAFDHGSYEHVLQKRAATLRAKASP